MQLLSPTAKWAIMNPCIGACDHPREKAVTTYDKAADAVDDYDRPSVVAGFGDVHGLRTKRSTRVTSSAFGSSSTQLPARWVWDGKVDSVHEDVVDLGATAFACHARPSPPTLDCASGPRGGGRDAGHLSSPRPPSLATRL